MTLCGTAGATAGDDDALAARQQTVLNRLDQSRRRVHMTGADFQQIRVQPLAMLAKQLNSTDRGLLRGLHYGGIVMDFSK